MLKPKILSIRREKSRNKPKKKRRRRLESKIAKILAKIVIHKRVITNKH